MPDFRHTQREVVGQEKPSSVKELRRLQRQIKELERRLAKEKQARAATTATLKVEIKELMQREQEVRESEEMLKLITNAVPAGISYFDREQRFRFANEKYKILLGLKPSELIGKTLEEAIGKKPYKVARQYAQRALSGQTASFENTLPAKNGGKISIAVSYVPDIGPDRTVKGFFALVQDITERKCLEGQLVRRERLATLGQLTATVGHELRNPLCTIRTSNFIVRDGLNGEAPRVKRALERIDRSVSRCDRIIDELLDFTRMSKIEPEPTTIDAWLGGVLAEQTLPAGVSLRREFGLFEVKVPLDRNRFRRAVINVFDNACQAMTGEVGREAADADNAVLLVKTQRKNGRVEVVFEDSGPGIPPDVLPNIFEPLFSTKSFGVGLGLPVVKQIMEQHGGGIEIDSGEGRGTRTCLWLPSDHLSINSPRWAKRNKRYALP